MLAKREAMTTEQARRMQRASATIRWARVSPEERRQAMGELARKRWQRISGAERADHGRKLAAARWSKDPAPLPASVRERPSIYKPIRRWVYLPQQLVTFLKRAAATEGISPAKYMRRLI